MDTKEAGGPDQAPPPRRQLLLRRAGVLLVIVGILGTVSLPLLVVRSRLQAADAAIVRAESALGTADLDAAVAALREAQAHALQAVEALRMPGARLLDAIPLTAPTTQALGAVARAGASLADTTATTLSAITAEDRLRSLLPRAGRLPLEELPDLTAHLTDARTDIRAVLEDLDAVELRWTTSGTTRVVLGARERTAEAVTQLDGAVALLDALDGYLGGHGPRRYFVAAQNPAEQRGTGGLIGAWGMLQLDRGQPRIGQFAPIQDLPELPIGLVDPPNADFRARYDRFGGTGAWRNLNMTPDFPTAAAAIIALYDEVQDERLDGVIAVDPFALRALLELTGPVEVPVLGSVGADGVVALLANDAYGRLPDPAVRKRLLGDVASAVLTRFLAGDVADVRRTATTVLSLFRNRHVIVHSVVASEQAAFATTGVDGALATGGGDYVSFTTNNASANKVDFYVDRELRYHVVLDPDGSATSVARVTFTNGSPTEGRPRYVLGPLVDGATAGELWQLVDVWCAPGCELVDADHSAGFGDAGEEVELGHPTHLSFGRVGADTEAWVESTRRLPGAWTSAPGDPGRYELRVQVQPAAVRTSLDLSVEVPAGRRIVATSPTTMQVDGRTARLRTDGNGRRIDLWVEFE